MLTSAELLSVVARVRGKYEAVLSITFVSCVFASLTRTVGSSAVHPESHTPTAMELSIDLQVASAACVEQRELQVSEPIATYYVSEEPGSFSHMSELTPGEVFSR